MKDVEGDDSMKSSPMDDPDEMAHFKQVVAAFFNYTVCIITILNSDL